jgi:hypothetical protein
MCVVTRERSTIDIPSDEYRVGWEEGAGVRVATEERVGIVVVDREGKLAGRYVVRVSLLKDKNDTRCVYEWMPKGM